MRNFRTFAAGAGFAMGMAGCFGRGTTEYQPPPEAFHSPRSLSEVLKSERPQDFYTETYRAFRFSSQSVLTLTGGEQTKTFQGSSALEIDEKGNYHLIRIPLSGESAVEVIHFDQKVYLKSGGENDFRVLRPQPEFARWLTVSLREIFSLYDQTHFGKNASSSTKGNLQCWTQDPNVLCIDPASGLPVEGTLKVPEGDHAILSVRFNFAPVKPESITVSPPA